MKCVKIVDVKKLEVSEMEQPIANLEDVTIKIDCCGICGSDIHNWDLGQPIGLVMGHEFAGTVVDPGSREDLKVGDKVTGLPISPCLKCNACKTGNFQFCKSTWSNAVGLSLTNPGGFSEYLTCRSDMVKKVPDNVSFESACMVEPSAISLHAVNLTDIKVGEKLLIVGGGIIGLMAAEFAKMDGASYVCLLEVNENRGKKALEFGYVDEFYDPTKEDTVAKLLEKTNGGFDKVIECCGNSAAVTEAMIASKPGGKIILVGVSVSNISIPSAVSVMGEVTLQGSIAYTEQEFEKTIELISEEKIDVEKYIDKKVSIDKVQEAFEILTSGTQDDIKIIYKNQ